MSVSGILEGYLTLYGWQVYASLFLLLVAMGGVCLLYTSRCV